MPKSTIINDEDDETPVGGQQAAGTSDVNRGTNRQQGSDQEHPHDRPATKAVGLPQTTRIILEENDNIPPTGQFFGFNGRNFILRAGEAANVPNGLVEILDNAVMKTPIKDPNTLKILGYRDKLRYPYRIVKG